jgi:DNA-binding NtrC family response regulator
MQALAVKLLPMFQLKRLFRIGKFTRKPGNAADSAHTATLLAITTDPDDRAALREIAASFAWNISIVDTLSAAMAALKAQPAPLVICDSELPDHDWRDVLAGIAGLPQPVCVLLASRVSDEYLLNEVTRHHGYDVVIKPFQREALRRAVTFAWSWCGWTSRNPDETRHA